MFSFTFGRPGSGRLRVVSSLFSGNASLGVSSLVHPPRRLHDAWSFLNFFSKKQKKTHFLQYLERRYNRWCRLYLCVASLILYVFTKVRCFFLFFFLTRLEQISVMVYSGALVMKIVVGMDMYLSALILVVYSVNNSYNASSFLVGVNRCVCGAWWPVGCYPHGDFAERHPHSRWARAASRVVNRDLVSRGLRMFDTFSNKSPSDDLLNHLCLIVVGCNALHCW